MANNFKKYFIIIISSMLLLVILAAPSFALASWWNPFSWGFWHKIAAIFQKTEVVQVQQQNNQPADETKDWKIYSETDFGFSFKYPKEWEVYDDLTLNTCCLNITNYGRMKPGRGYLEKGDIKIQFAKYNKSPSISLKDFVFSQTYMESDIKATIVRDIEIAGIKAVYSNLSDDNYYLPINDARGILVYIFNHPESKESFKNIVDKFLSTFKFTNTGPLEQGSDTPAPFIESISPQSGLKGTIVEIRGKNLSGFEGDLDVYFERPDGKKIMLTDNFGDYPKTGGNLIKIKIVEPCRPGEKVYGRYSGIESVCNFIELIPGIYKVYTEPWGKRSNIINFEITK
jgi:hypothetical protein